MPADCETQVADFCRFLRDLPRDGADFEVIKFASLAALGCYDIIDNYLSRHHDPETANQVIARALNLSHGPGHIFTQHGVMRSIRSLICQTDRPKVVKTLRDFCDRLAAEGYPSFITSGTLLGVVRDNDFIAHDDDIDLCYISVTNGGADVVSERIKIFRCISLWEEFSIREATGGHFHVSFLGDGPHFNFDLFTSWVSESGHFNEYPLTPNTLNAAHILPLSYREFYGVSIPTPRQPEFLLELNYGQRWHIPDPSFRFDWDKNAAFYEFLTASKIAQ